MIPTKEEIAALRAAYECCDEEDCGREVEWLEAQHVEIEKLRCLLIEWTKTPFFDDEDDWQRWVDEFGARVREAIS